MKASHLALLLLAFLAILGGGTQAQAAAPKVRPVCGTVALGHARCFSWVKGNATPLAQTPSGYGPADLQSAYALPSATAGSGQTVAIVDAFDDPTAEQDLGTYRANYGLPPCTTANGCFRKVNENGGTLPMPPPGADWGLEISLDLDMVSAVCPNCHILLVEATTNLNSDLYTAVDTAARLGANAISNSYGGGESSSETSTGDVHFNHPGVAITASSGDNGYGVSYPAASRYVTAVGGTSLSRGGDARLDRSRLERRRQRLQRLRGEAVLADRQRLRKRTVADVSAVADPNTGVAVALRRALVHGRRHERVLADHRGRLRARRQRLERQLRLVSVLAHDEPVRRRDRQQRHLLARVPLHRRWPATTARPGSARRTAPPAFKRSPQRGARHARAPRGRLATRAIGGTMWPVPHRAELQGLRAVAVLLVVLDHARRAVPAGRLRRGRRLLRPLRLPDHRAAAAPGTRRDGRIRLTDFYVRRARRILPAAVLTLVVTDLVAHQLLNVVRAREAVARQRLGRLLHGERPLRRARAATTSRRASRPRRCSTTGRSRSRSSSTSSGRSLLAAVLGDRVASAGGCSGSCSRRAVRLVRLVDPQHRDDAAYAYFSTATRAWELALGAALAIAAPAAARRPPAWAGLACICVAARRVLELDRRSRGTRRCCRRSARRS